MSREKPKAKNKVKWFYLVALLISLGVVILYAYNVMTVEMNQKQVESEHEALLLEKARLEEELNHVMDPRYIEQQARTQLRMIYPGEILYILPDKPEDKNGEE